MKLVLEFDLDSPNYTHKDNSPDIQAIIKTLQDTIDLVKQGYMGFNIRDINRNIVGSIHIDYRYKEPKIV